MVQLLVDSAEKRIAEMRGGGCYLLQGAGVGELISGTFFLGRYNIHACIIRVLNRVVLYSILINIVPNILTLRWLPIAHLEIWASWADFQHPISKSHKQQACQSPSCKRTSHSH
jgi:hypothetical protein